MSQLNKKPEISDLVPLTYSVLVNNIDLAKQKNVKSEYSFLNLEKLVYEFPLNNSFISKSYYQSDPEFSYNEPPKGPIENHFECIYCRQSGPDNHLKNCRRPLNSSLYLFEDFKGYQEGTPYNIVINKRGQKKVVSKSMKSDKFLDSVEIIYSDVNKRETVVRIAKNGSINIISAGFGNKKLVDEVINKINQTSALNLQEYRKVYPTANKLEIDPRITYTYLMFAQFNLYPKELQEKYYINLGMLGNELKKYIIKVNNQQVLTFGNKEYLIDKYEINTGDVLSRSNKLTNPLINFNLINGYLKFNIVIYKRGAVQIRLSYNQKYERSPENKLVLNDLQLVYQFLDSLFTELLSNSRVIVSEEPKLKRGIDNMVDGKQPQMCHDRQGLRPVPYSFHGICPDPGMYVRPEGKKRADGRYEPCCYKLKDNGKDSITRYKEILKHGYPDKGASKYDENIPNPDNKSAVFIPGTKVIESRRFSGLDSLGKNELLNCISESGYIKPTDVFDTNTFLELKNKVLNEYSYLTSTKNLVFQHPVTLTPNTFSLFTKDLYMVTPINNETIKVLLFFNSTGVSHFINENYDVSQTGLPDINKLKETLIEGYLYPYKDELVFYPYDILYLLGNQVNKPFYSGNSRETRFYKLMHSIEIINSVESELIIETPRFDLDIIGGSKNFLTNKDLGDISSLLFIPINEEYLFGKVNRKLLIWNNTTKESNNLLTLNVYSRSGNKWEVKIDSKSIPSELLPQESGTIEIPVVFSNKYKLKDGDLVLFKINKLVNNTINTKKPLTPLDKSEEQLTDYFTVINILESIQTPISKGILSNGIRWTINGITYSQSKDSSGKPEINKPLLINY